MKANLNSSSHALPELEYNMLPQLEVGARMNDARIGLLNVLRPLSLHLYHTLYSSAFNSSSYQVLQRLGNVLPKDTTFTSVLR